MSVCTLIILWASFRSGAALAGIPEPDAVIFGSVSLDGFEVQSPGFVEARVGNATLATYVIGSNPAAGNAYVLRVGIESLEDGSSPDPGKVRADPPTSISLYVNGVNINQSVLINQRGAIVERNLVASDPNRIANEDGDLYLNWQDNCGSTANNDQADTNGNGIGDACEALVVPRGMLSISSNGGISNPADDTGLGSVSYDYEIQITEVTNAQYRDFLAAVATDADLHGLYNEEMGANPRGGIERVGSVAPFNYRVRPNMADKPVNFVSWLDAARYANWVANGELDPGADTTETGAFDLTVALPELNASFSGSLDDSWSLPTENEWYKAAYYDPTQGTYSDYPTRSNMPPQVASASPIGDIDNAPDPSGNLANYAAGARWAGQIGNVTTVSGTLAGSFYNVADQGGNVGEWLADDSEQGQRVVRGGSYASDAIALHAEAGSIDRSEVLMDPFYEGPDVGFRLLLPEPKRFHGLLAGFGLIVILRRRRLYRW